MKEKIVSILLAATLAAGVAPTTAFAAGSASQTKTAQPKVPVIRNLKVDKQEISFSIQPQKGIDFIVYFSEDGGESYDETGTDSVFSADELTPQETYSFYVEARNENGAVKKTKVFTKKTPKAQTQIEGVTEDFSKKAREEATDEVTVVSPAGRTLNVQMKNSKGKWVTKEEIELEDSYDEQSLTVELPNDWWQKEKSTWRYQIAANEQATGFTSESFEIKAQRYYQNPKKYVQVKTKISKHGLKYYTSPVLTTPASTKKECIEAMIDTAYKYKGDPYIVGRSGKPGKGVDCSGIVMQACYGAGVDLWPSNPSRHRLPKYEYESRYIARMKTLKTVSWKRAKRGDLIFYSKRGIVIHVAIYLGKGRIIHSWPGHVMVSSATNGRWGKISKVKRIFN